MPEGPFLNTPVPLTGTNSQRICLTACPYGGRSIDEWMQSLRLREHTPEAKPDQLVVGTRQRNVRVCAGTGSGVSEGSGSYAGSSMGSLPGCRYSMIRTGFPISDS
jgi:hypothetical protein